MLAKLKALGPGLLYAGAAIGVSHLVQSTKAGAKYGFILISAILLSHLFKYPFFVLGPRYARATGESLVEGFARQGKWATWLLLGLTLGTMFAIQAAVTLVTAGLVKQFGLSANYSWVSLGILVVCFAIASLKNTNVLNHLMKTIMIVLSISTLVAFVLSFSVSLPTPTDPLRVFDILDHQDFSFLLSFVGWMPAPLDIAIWHSIWSLSATRQARGDFDFKVGFYGTAILGICFVALGANTMYGTGTAIEPSAGGFAQQLIQSFTTCLGPWSYWFIAIAAFTTMFSTTLTCFDAMPRVLARVLASLRLYTNKELSLRLCQIVLLVGTYLILFFAVENMQQMVAFATIISFLTAPILAILSYLLVTRNVHLILWNKQEMLLAQLGIGLLSVISLLYILSIL